MDWKIPATIVILVVVVSLGVLPFFSTNFSDSLTGFFSPIKDFFSNIFHREIESGGKVVLYLSTNELGNLKIGIPTNVYFKLNDNYNLIMDDKNLVVKQNLLLKNFTGTINFKNFSISGKVTGISSENFDLEGSSKIQTDNKKFEELTISNLQIAELTINKGKINTEKPRKIEAEIDDTSKLYGFIGTLTYKNNTALFEGNCTKFQMEGLSLGE